VGPPISEVQLAPHREELSIFFGAPCTRRPRNETYTYDKSVLNLRSHGLNYNAGYSTSPVTARSKEVRAVLDAKATATLLAKAVASGSLSLCFFSIFFLYLNFKIICTLYFVNLYLIN